MKILRTTFPKKGTVCWVCERIKKTPRIIEILGAEKGGKN
jgi:hypothetical protein